MINKTLRRLAVGAAAITVLGVVVPLAAATDASAATTVSGVTAQPSPSTAGTTPAQYDVNFTTSASGALAAGAGTVTLSLPSDSVLPSTASDYVINGTAAGTVTGTSPTMTITTPVAIGNGSTVHLTVSGAKNPTNTGSYNATVYTSSDTGPIQSSAYTIGTTANPPVTGPVTVTPGTPGSTAVYRTSLTASTSGALAAGSGTITLSGPTGTVFPLVASDYTVNGVASSATPSQTAANNVTFTTPVPVAAGGTAKVAAAGVTNPAAGTYKLTESTSSDSTTAQSGSYTIAPAQTTVTSVTGPNPTPASAGATNAKYTFGFTTTTKIASGGTITITAPTGTVFTKTNTDYTVNGVNPTTAAPTSGAVANNTTVLTINNTGGIAAGTAVTVVANNVTNPGAGTTYTDSIVTSGDPGTATTPAYTITAASTQVTSVPAPTVSPDNAGSTAAYSIPFTPAHSVPAGGTITITAPTGTVFPSTLANYTVNNGTDSVAPTSVTGGGTKAITITTPIALPTTGATTVTVTGVTNPSTQSTTDTLSVHTSSDTTDKASQNYTIGAPATGTSVSGLTFSASSYAPASTPVTDTVKFTTSSTGALTAGTNAIGVYTNGQTLPATANSYTVNGQTVTATPTPFTETIGATTYNGYFFTTPISIGNSSAVTVGISGATNLTAGSYGFVVNTDQDGNNVLTNYAITTGVATQGTTNQPTVTPNNAGATANYSFAYTPASALPAGGTITVTGPTGTVFPSTASSYVVNNVVSPGPVTGGGSNSVTFTSPAFLPAGSPASITIAGVTNPTTQSTTDKLAVSTSTDATPAMSSTAYSITAANTAVTGVTGPNPTPASAGANPAVYTVGFTTHAALAAGDTITLAAPAGTVFSSTGSDYTVNNVAASGATGGSTTAINVTNAIPAGTAVTLVANKVTNPAAGTYTLAVSTKNDATPVNTPSYTITAAVDSVSGVGVMVNPNTAGSPAGYGIAFTASHAVPAGGTITVAAPAGTAFPLVASYYTVDGVATTVTPTQTATNNVTITTPIALAAGTSHQIVAIGVTNPTTPSTTDTLSVATSTDTVPANSNPYVIAAGATAPAVTSVSPASGSFQGGTTVTITGSNLGSASTATVTFGSNNAAIVSDNGTTLVVTSPAGTTGATVPVTVTVGGVSSAANSSATFTYTTASSDYLPVTPKRIMSDQAVSANSAFTFTLPSSVPAGTGAVAFNVTAVNPNTVGNLRVYPACGTSTTPPTISLVNYEPAHDTANFLVVSLQCPDGTLTNKVNFYSANSNVTVDVDLAGTYPSKTTGSSDAHATVTTVPGFTGVGPTRVESDQSIAANTSKKFTLSGIPSGAKAVALNVTSIHPNGNGNLRVYPGDQTTVPPTSNVNFIPGVDKAGFVIINLPADGSNTINIYSAGTASSVDVDLFGVFPAGASTTGLAQPVRVLDTRAGSGTTQGLPDPLAIGTPYNVTVTGNGVPANASAVVVSLTAIHAAGSSGVGNLRAYPAGGTVPNVSNINYIGPKADVANLAIVRVGANGQITLVTNGSVIDAAVDVLGYVPAPSS